MMPLPFRTVDELVTTIVLLGSLISVVGFLMWGIGFLGVLSSLYANDSS